ncbi:MAG: penicillin-binding protein 2 [Dorea sp.]|nr:penicillin-binding protein 2 [Dorea sp.]
MAKRKRIRRRKRKFFSTLMQKKLVLLYVVIVLAFIFLLGNVVVMNASKGNEYTKDILRQQDYGGNNIPSKRGDIMDVNGTKLATSERVFTVMMDNMAILEDPDYVEPTKDVLINIFGADPETVEQQLTEFPESRYFVIARDVPYENEVKYEEVMDMQKEAEKKLQQAINNSDTKVRMEDVLTEQEIAAYNVHGLWLEEGYKRNYPYNTFACDLIGFVMGSSSSGFVGFNGIEASYNSELNGTDGKKYGYLNSNSQFETTITEPIPGNSVRTTIDMEAQSIVEYHVKAMNDSLKNLYREGEGSKATGVVVMNPQNGEIIAMASYPTYNLNDPYDLSMYFDEDYYKQRTLDDIRANLASTADDMEIEELTAFFGTDIAAEYSLDDLRYLRRQAFLNLTDEELSAYYTDEEYKEKLRKMESQVLNEEWANFCTDVPFEPGSTAKPFTVAAGLESGALNGKEVYDCGGFLHRGDHDIYCANKYGHGPQNLKQSIANSCNVALMYIGQALGVEQFCRFQSIFGFGQPSGIDLAEAETSYLIYKAEDMGDADLATNAFGQNFYVTMTQLCASFCSLVNGGYYYEPHVVKQIEDVNGNVVKTIAPKVTRRTISEETSELVKEYMLSVVTEGTATKAQIPGYDIGGKTGTAEKIPRDTGKYVISFIGYAPQDNPEVVIYCVMDEPNVEKQDNGSYTTILAEQIMEDLFPYLGITRNDNQIVMPTGHIYSNLLKPDGSLEQTGEENVSADENTGDEQTDNSDAENTEHSETENSETEDNESQ